MFLLIVGLILGLDRYGDRCAYLRNDLHCLRTLKNTPVLAERATMIAAEMSEAVSAAPASQISGNLAKGGGEEKLVCVYP